MIFFNIICCFYLLVQLQSQGNIWSFAKRLFTLMPCDHATANQETSPKLLRQSKTEQFFKGRVFIFFMELQDIVCKTKSVTWVIIAASVTAEMQHSTSTVGGETVGLV